MIDFGTSGRARLETLQKLRIERQSALIVDDDDVFRTRLGRAFPSRGWEALLAGTVDEMIALAARSGSLAFQKVLPNQNLT